MDQGSRTERRNDFGLQTNTHVVEKHWTVRYDEAHISHQTLLGKGGYGEVHRVKITPFVHANIEQMLDARTGTVVILKQGTPCIVLFVNICLM